MVDARKGAHLGTGAEHPLPGGHSALTNLDCLYTYPPFISPFC